MSNTTTTISKAFQNVEIKPGQSFRFSQTNGNPDDYYSFSVTAADESFLMIENGWYNNGSYKGAACTVNNIGSTAVSFDLIILTVSETGAVASDVKVEKV